MDEDLRAGQVMQLAQRRRNEQLHFVQINRENLAGRLDSDFHATPLQLSSMTLDRRFPE